MILISKTFLSSKQAQSTLWIVATSTSRDYLKFIAPRPISSFAPRKAFLGNASIHEQSTKQPAFVATKPSSSTIFILENIIRINYGGEKIKIKIRKNIKITQTTT